MIAIILPLFAASAPALPQSQPPWGEWALSMEERGIREVTTSPDGRWKAMIYGFGRTAGAGWDDALWIESAESGEMKCLVGRSCPENGGQWGMTQLAFGMDVDEVYFVGGPGWHTNHWIHRVNLATGKVEFFADGLGIHVIKSGPHRGQLIIKRIVGFVEPGDGTNTDAIYAYVLVDRNDHTILQIPEAGPGQASNGYSHWLEANGWE